MFEYESEKIGPREAGVQSVTRFATRPDPEARKADTDKDAARKRAELWAKRKQLEDEGWTP